jgi:lysophospholipase L1-like esterase
VPRADKLASETKVFAQHKQMFADLGIPVVSLEGAYGNDQVNMPEAGNHPSARGHKLLADRLFQLLPGVMKW